MVEPPTDSVHCEQRDQWRSWLQTNHQSSKGVWLITWCKAAGRPIVTYDEMVEEALCFGWVDSVGKKLDDERTMLRFTPRKPTSAWSRPNKIRIARMTEAGLMTAAGQAAVDIAKANGRWEALDAVEDLEVPADLEAAFQEFPGSGANFEAFPRSAKRGILEWISQAKRPETRAKRLKETAEKASKNERANQWTGPKTKRSEI